MFPKVTLILGGASSGKSAFAENLVKSCDKSWVYLATAEALDEEMTTRIARHRQSRGNPWRLIEEPLEIARALSDATKDEIILLDCATMWLSNQLFHGRDLTVAQTGLCAALLSCAAPVVVVSNEVGLGGVMQNKLARQFGEAQGQLNIALANQADLVVQVITGLPMVLKGALPQ
jgi:adenosylcobinamide kinase/adenosylcobinamide-phosphate guanylyltransferase